MAGQGFLASLFFCKCQPFSMKVGYQAIEGQRNIPFPNFSRYKIAEKGIFLLWLPSLSKHRSMKCRDTLENTRGKGAKVKEGQTEDEA